MIEQFALETRSIRDTWLRFPLKLHRIYSDGDRITENNTKRV